VTIIVPKGFINASDPEWQDLFVQSVRGAFGTRAVTIQELGG
jgi:hypothetical protein